MKTLLLCSVSLLALGASGAAFAAGKPMPLSTTFTGKVHRAPSALPGRVTLFDQNNNTNGHAVVASNFTGGFTSAYTSFGADDFVIPLGHKWKIKEVDVTGTYFGGGPATSENVLFYKTRNGLPGDLVAKCDNLKGADNQGAFAIAIPKTCKVTLRGGKTYWVSVAPNIDFQTSGQWGWETRNGQNGNAAAWENPENGFGTGCTTWNVMTSCVGNAGDGPDFMFALKGRDVVL